MAGFRSFVTLVASVSLVSASECPYGHTSAQTVETLEKRAPEGAQALISPFVVNDTDAHFITTEAGGPIEDQFSLKAGERGPTLLEDFIFRQKITHFDHERVSGSDTVGKC
jgi:catalase